MKKESIKFALGVLIIAIVFLDLALLHIDAPFNHVTGDSDGLYGMAAKNLATQGAGKLGFGMYTSIIRNGDVLPGNFYTHHPDGFVFLTVILYKIFGISEATTRLGSLLAMLLALCLFAFALRKIFQNDLKAWLVTLLLAILPGFIFYSEVLETAVWSLGAALITFSLFIFCAPNAKPAKFFLFYLSVFLGGLVGWFFYFMPAAIWLYVLFSKAAGKTKLLILLPLISLVAAALDFAQFFWLNGNVAGDLLAAADFRTGSVSWYGWLSKILFMLRLQATDIFLILGAAGLIVFLWRLKKNAKWRIFLPLLFFPLLVCAGFREWVLHPFGIIYFLPIIAVLGGLAIFSLYDFLARRFARPGKIFAVGLATAVILTGAYFSFVNLDIFFNKFIILDQQDVRLLQYLSQMDNLKDDDICLGANDFSISYGALAEWYLGKKLSCEPGKYKVALVFNPDLDQKLGGGDDFYTKHYRDFKSEGFSVTGCSGFLCLMTNADISGLPPLQNPPQER